jgi:hypothetical protein
VLFRACTHQGHGAGFEELRETIGAHFHSRIVLESPLNGGCGNRKPNDSSSSWNEQSSCILR